MHLHLVSVFVLIESLLSCGSSPENFNIQQANLDNQSQIKIQQSVGKDRGTARNIVFQSNDLGQNWQDVSAGLPDSLTVGRVYANGRELFLASGSKLFRSNTGNQFPVWENESLQTFDGLQKMEITNLFPAKTGLYVSSYRKGFYKGIPGSHTWFPMDQALTDKTVRCVMETSNGALFVGVESGLFKSVDGGITWKQVIQDMGINSLSPANADETVLVCGTYEGLRRSTDGGEHWDLVLTEDFGAWHLKRFEGGIVSITEGGSWKDGSRSNRLRLSTDNGKTWQRIDEGFAQLPFMYDAEENSSASRRIHGIEQLGKYLFCSTNAGIFRSDNMGKTWELVRLTDGKEMFELAVSGNVLYAIQIVGC